MLSSRIPATLPELRGAIHVIVAKTCGYYRNKLSIGRVPTPSEWFRARA
jgi:hypothetical protein